MMNAFILRRSQQVLPVRNIEQLPEKPYSNRRSTVNRRSYNPTVYLVSCWYWSRSGWHHRDVVLHAVCRAMWYSHGRSSVRDIATAGNCPKISPCSTGIRENDPSFADIISTRALPAALSSRNGALATVLISARNRRHHQPASERVAGRQTPGEN